MRLNATTKSAALWSALFLTIASTAFASGAYPPLPGTYKTLTNTVLPGRATESMPCDGCEGQVGNLVTAQSWNGTALGTNWAISCPQLAASPTLVYDGVVGGTGQRIYQTAYTGGTLWLAGTGAWGAGDPYYTGEITSFTVVAAKQYVSGQLVGVVSNINFTGSIDGYGDCFTLAISNAEFVGATPGAPAVPGLFPAFQGPTDCNLTGTSGTWWDVHDVTFSIIGDCVVGARSSSWGALKGMYR